jgi:hypothetical protein
MRISGIQRKQLHDALLAAFPSHSALEQMVSFGMDTSLAMIAGLGPLGDATFRLIEWAESQGRLEELVHTARAANPGESPPACYRRGTGISPGAAGRRDARAAGT